ncbi:hypothetical protein Taro_008617 [Colocasia esculenta]|uniref:Signal peptidase complex subunit 3 n=1 Tax=Colocasia esculenta TaxID=4460 RepID=A0A843U2T8_COLES|nr:hypothetical protein [Colocasia esculenta]
MHSFGYRANALVTFAVTILALLCAMATLSDNLNVAAPTARIEVLNINWFQRQPNGNDEVFVFVAAEYETPQNSLNQGSNLLGKEVNLTLHWHVMPKTGKMFADRIVMTGYRLPEDHR